MKILILTYWAYDDALIQTYTLPYVRIMAKHLPSGSDLILTTLENRNVPPAAREAVQAELEGHRISWLPLRYRSFGWRAMMAWLANIWKLRLLIVRNKISVIHCWCTPAGAIGYLLSLLTGARLVIDSYEPHAEAMVENGTWERGGIAFQLLFWLERRQTERASAVVSATAGMRDYVHKKYKTKLPPFFVKPACVDLELFNLNKKRDPDLTKELSLEGKIVCLYAGKFGGIYQDREVFEFLREASAYWGDRLRMLLLTGHTPKEVVSFCTAAGVDPRIVIQRFVAHRDVALYMGLADFALCPVKPVPTKKYCTPIKNGEYWAMGLPVVIPDHISDDADIIEANEAGVVLKRFTPAAYQAALKMLDLMMRDKEKMETQIRNLAITYRNFNVAERVYHDIYGAKGLLTEN